MSHQVMETKTIVTSDSTGEYHRTVNQVVYEIPCAFDRTPRPLAEFTTDELLDELRERLGRAEG